MFLMMPSTKSSDSAAWLNKMANKLKKQKKTCLNDIFLTTGQNIISSCARMQVSDPGLLGPLVLFVCLFVFVALRPMSTAMVIAGRSVHLTTLFPGQA